MKKPNKKILPLLIAALISLSVIYYAAFYGNNKETYTASITATSTVESPALGKDSDNDGLKDWEEALWKTDPYNPDTDGDGTPDGLEIKQGRNPLIAGPNDKLDVNTVTTKINTETESDLSETDKFSRDLFLKIIAAKQANAPPSQTDLANYMSTTIEQELERQKPKSFTESDFAVDAAETPEKIQVYADRIVSIMTKKPPKSLEYEMITVNRAQKNNDPKELKKLEPLISEYERIENDLLKTPVPRSAVAQHVAFTNAAAGMVYSISGLERILTDPIKAMPGVASYGDNVQAFAKGLRELKAYFANANVVFEEGSNGYKLFNGI